MKLIIIALLVAMTVGCASKSKKANDGTSSRPINEVDAVLQGLAEPSKKRDRDAQKKFEQDLKKTKAE